MLTPFVCCGILGDYVVVYPTVPGRCWSGSGRLRQCPYQVIWVRSDIIAAKSTTGEWVSFRLAFSFVVGGHPIWHACCHLFLLTVSSLPKLLPYFAFYQGGPANV